MFNPISSFIQRTSQTTTPQIEIPKSELPTREFQAEGKPQNHSLRSQAVRVVAAVLTLGISEGLRKGIGYALVNTGELDKESRQKEVEGFKKENSDYRDFSTKLAIGTSDGAQLDGMMIKPRYKYDQETDPAKQKYVIWLNGHGQSYEAKLNPAVTYANEANANILLFNYRGGGDSKGVASSAKDFVTDTLSMVESLTHMGVPPENIVIHGYSMGGGVGALAAAQQEGVRHINERSFDVFSKVAKDSVATFAKEHVSEAAATAIGNVAGTVMKKVGFELDVRKVIHNQEGAELANIRDRVLVVHHEKDDVVSKENSLHHYTHETGPEPLVQKQCVVLKKDTNEIYRELEPIISNEKNQELLKECGVASYEKVMTLKGQTPSTYISYLSDNLNKKITSLESQTESLVTMGWTHQEIATQVEAFKKLDSDLMKINRETSTPHGEDLTSFKQANQIYQFVREIKGG